MSHDAASLDWSKIPPPIDDGGARRLAGARTPSIALAATDGTTVDLSAIPGLALVFAYPRTGDPTGANPEGWDQIPGARGCTAESCGFRDHFEELRSLGVDRLFGLSTQDTTYQSEVVARLRLPFPILSDDRLALTEAMGLPSFKVDGMTLLKRLTLVIVNGVVEHVFHPVFPPDAHAGEVVAWLSDRAAEGEPKGPQSWRRRSRG